MLNHRRIRPPPDEGVPSSPNQGASLGAPPAAPPKDGALGARSLSSGTPSKEPEQNLSSSAGLAPSSAAPPPISSPPVRQWGELAPPVSAVEATEKSQKLPTPDVYGNEWGDVFKLAKLLELAGVPDLDKIYNNDGWTGRQAGTVLEVKAVYNNMYRLLSNFGYRSIEYTYEVSELPMPYVSKIALSREQPEDFPRTRRYEVAHGVLVWFKVGGQFGFFNVVYLLLMLTTAFALIASAVTLTDLLAVYLHPRKKNYFHLKYEVSPDFGNMWRCSECGFYNHQEEASCSGAEKWSSLEDGNLCKAPRPRLGR